MVKAPKDKQPQVSAVGIEEDITEDGIPGEILDGTTSEERDILLKPTWVKNQLETAIIYLKVPALEANKPAHM